MTRQPVASGRRETRDGLDWVVLTRTYRAAIDDVWAAVTEPHRLARWIGTWDGAPAEGTITFRMLFEGDDPAPETVIIDECVPPRTLALTMPAADEKSLTWHVRLDLSEAGGTTTLSFAQSLPDRAMAESMGPGWDYYLDRLVIAESHGDVDSVRFDDYYPALSGHYRAAFGLE